jgi:hypothetical protein
MIFNGVLDWDLEVRFKSVPTTDGCENVGILDGGSAVAIELPKA